jgi:hypothetical protein
MIKLITDIIKTVFEDKTKRLISLLTLFLCLGIPVAFEHFEIPKMLPSSLLPLFLHLSTIMLVVIFGLFALLFTSSSKPKVPLAKEIKSRKDLSPNALLILTVFGKQDDNHLTTEQFSKALELSFNQAQYAIDELLKLSFLHTDTPWGESTLYWLSTKGRAFLGKEKLL